MNCKTPLSLLLLGSMALLVACGGGSGGGADTLGTADLAPAKAPGASFYYSNALVGHVIHVANQGDGDAPASTLTVVYSTVGGDVVSTHAIPALPAGAMSGPIMTTLPAGTTSSQVRMVVDSADAVAESDETNNEDIETILF